MGLEWINNGAEVSGGAYVVAWKPADGTDAQVVSTFSVRPENKWRQFRVQVVTYYRAGGWEHQETNVRGEAHRSREVAQAWARRDAEMEAANVHAIGWDGVPA